MTDIDLNDRVKNVIASLKEAEDLARHKGDHGDDLSDLDLHIIANACEDAIITIRLLRASLTPH